jgi:hypothetical protein
MPAIQTDIEHSELIVGKRAQFTFKFQSIKIFDNINVGSTIDFRSYSSGTEPCVLEIAYDQEFNQYKIIPEEITFIDFNRCAELFVVLLDEKGKAISQSVLASFGGCNDSQFAVMNLYLRRPYNDTLMVLLKMLVKFKPLSDD